MPGHGPRPVLDGSLIVAVEFWQGATQRELASFSSVSEAFTGVLPFKRNPGYQREGLMNVK